MIKRIQKRLKIHPKPFLRISFLVFAVSACFSSPAFCGPSGLELFDVPTSSATPARDLPERALRQRPVKINFGLLNSAVRRGDDTIIFNFFDDVLDVGFVEKTIIRSYDSYSILGSINYEKTGSFIITVKNGVALGNIHTPDGNHYMIHFTGDDHIIRQIDDTLFAGCATDEVLDNPAESSEPSAPMDVSALDDASTFDVMVVYTPAALAARGGTTAMEAHIDLAVDEANAGYAASLIIPRIRLVHTAEISYSEAAGFDVALGDLQGASDGNMDNVHALRDTYGADFVCLFIDNPDYCGIAYLMTTLSPTFEAGAFSVVAWNCATGYYSFAHELGHNMGCAHATPESPQGEGLYNYSMGWRFASNAYRTVMAYSPGTRINRFSNPNVSYAGYPTGIPLGQSNEAYNALTIDNVANTVANFRQSITFEDSPPTANNGSELITADTPQTIQFNATDDGLPDPPAMLDTIIVTLPANGLLEDSNGAIINSVPYTLPGNTSSVRYIPNAGFSGSNFVQFKANDSASDSNIATITIDVVHRIYFANMDSDPGFVLDTGSQKIKWEWGASSGGGARKYGNPDPLSAFTGQNMLGYNLSGDYARITATQWATTPAIDCSASTGTMLQFYRWLNIEQSLYDHAYVEVSNDGSNWNTVWENTDQITDSTWQLQNFDISAVADGQATLYVRWGMGTADQRVHFSGWNIDDVAIKGYSQTAGLIGDIVDFGKVDYHDFAVLGAQWLNSGCVDPDRCNGADIIKDGTVDIYDLFAMANYWLDTTP